MLRRVAMDVMKPVNVSCIPKIECWEIFGKPLARYPPDPVCRYLGPVPPCVESWWLLLLDHCLLYMRHWESWPHIQKIKEHPLQELVKFLTNNPLAFMFEHAPGQIPIYLQDDA